VKGWYAVFSALLFFIPQDASAADGLNGAAGELARKTAAFIGKGESVSVVWRNVGSLGAPELGQARGLFEAALRDAGSRIAELAPTAEAQITLSENASQYLLVEEIHKGDDRQVWISAWKRAAPPTTVAPGATIEKRLIWEQTEPILDLAFAGENLLLLSTTHVNWLAKLNGQWAIANSLELPPQRVWPRDVRGRLRVNATGFEALLPGMACKGSVPPVFLDCRPSDEPWVLESGSRALLLANFVANRNFFDGRITTQAGVRKTVGPFYSAAAAEEGGRQFWLLAMLDGRTQMVDSAFDPVGSINGWGSDIVGTAAHCGGGTQVLATHLGDATEPDAIQAFAIVNRTSAALTSPVAFPGPVTALWPASGGSAVAVALNLTSGKYETYVLTVVCGG
jgi:hypothetical protein